MCPSPFQSYHISQYALLVYPRHAQRFIAQQERAKINCWGFTTWRAPDAKIRADLMGEIPIWMEDWGSKHSCCYQPQWFSGDICKPKGSASFPEKSWPLLSSLCLNKERAHSSPSMLVNWLNLEHIPRPKCRSCHRATMVIAVRAHCNPLDIYKTEMSFVWLSVCLSVCMSRLEGCREKGGRGGGARETGRLDRK